MPDDGILGFIKTTSTDGQERPEWVQMGHAWLQSAKLDLMSYAPRNLEDCLFWRGVKYKDLTPEEKAEVHAAFEKVLEGEQ